MFSKFIGFARISDGIYAESLLVILPKGYDQTYIPELIEYTSSGPRGLGLRNLFKRAMSASAARSRTKKESSRKLS